MKTTIKRMLSCVSVLAVCLLSHVGVQAKTITTPQISNLIEKSSQALIKNDNAPLVLFEGSQISASEQNSIAYHYSHNSHYSHSSHMSHQSHYSSRW